MRPDKILCSEHRKEYVHLVGNATSGIYLALKAYGISGKGVAVPNSICPNVPLAVLYSGNTPVFIDISWKDLGLDISDLGKKAQEFDVVIANHSYGSVCDIVAIQDFCRKNHKILIEDIAVAQGARCGEAPVGSFGDISVVSFGAGKIISIGHGGAVMSDDNGVIAEVKKFESEFNSFSAWNEEKILLLANHFRDMYNNNYGKASWKIDSSFRELAARSEQAFYFKFSNKYEERLAGKLEQLSHNISRRAEMAAILTQLIKGEGIDNLRVFEPPAGSVYWRFNVFLDKGRDALLKHLLKEGYRVSSWYPSVNVLFEKETERSTTPNSDALSDRILNIWVNDEIDRDYLKSIVKEIKEQQQAVLS